MKWSALLLALLCLFAVTSPAAAFKARKANLHRGKNLKQAGKNKKHGEPDMPLNIHGEPILAGEGAVVNEAPPLDVTTGNAAPIVADADPRVDLQHDLEEKQEEIERLASQNDDLRKEIDELRLASGSQVEKLLSVTTLKEGLEQEVKDLQVKVDTLQQSVDTKAGQLEEKAKIIEHLESIQSERNSLESSQQKYLSMIKLLKDGSREIERQLGACQNKMEPLRQESTKLHEYLRGNRTAWEIGNKKTTTENDHLQHELESVKEELQKHLSGASNNDQALSECQESLRACERSINTLEQEKQRATENEPSLTQLKETNQKLLRLGRVLRDEKDECLVREADTRKLLDLERDVCENLKAMVQQTQSAGDSAVNPALKAQEDLVAHLSEKVKALTEQVGAERGSEVELTAQVNAMKEKLEECTKNQFAHEDELATIQEKADTSSEEASACEERASACLDASQTLEKEKEKIEHDVEAKEAEITELETKLSSQTNVLESVRGQLNVLQQERDEAVGNAETLSEKEKAVREEVRHIEKMYHQYKEKVDDPALFDYMVKKAEWLKKPKLEGLDAAYTKTLDIIGPSRLGKTEVALIEMQALVKQSSARLSKIVGKPEYSTVMSGMLTYGIFLIPFGVSLCLVVRLRNALSVEKGAMWMTLYNALFCAFLYGLALYMKEEPLHALRKHNKGAFDFLQFAMAAGYCVYCLFVVLTTVKQTVVQRCTITLTKLVQLVIPFVIGANYYALAWKPAMLDAELAFEGDYWGLYSFGFAVVFTMLTCGRGKTQTVPTAKPVHDDLALPLHVGRDTRSKSKLSDVEDNDVLDDLHPDDAEDEFGGDAGDEENALGEQMHDLDDDHESDVDGDFAVGTGVMTSATQASTKHRNKGGKVKKEKKIKKKKSGKKKNRHASLSIVEGAGDDADESLFIDFVDPADIATSTKETVHAAAQHLEGIQNTGVNLTNTDEMFTAPNKLENEKLD